MDLRPNRNEQSLSEKSENLKRKDIQKEFYSIKFDFWIKVPIWDSNPNLKKGKTSIPFIYSPLLIFYLLNHLWMPSLINIKFNPKSSSAEQWILVQRVRYPELKNLSIDSLRTELHIKSFRYDKETQFSTSRKSTSKLRATKFPLFKNYRVFLIWMKKLVFCTLRKFQNLEALA